MKEKEFFDLAEEMEAACGDWENSEGFSTKAKAELLQKVAAMEAAESGKEPVKSEPPKKLRLKKRYILILAAALVLMLGMSAVGDRAWIADSTELERESEITTKINNEEKASVLLEEEAICQEIGQKLGIVPMWLGYIPEGMVLDSYVITEGTGWAYVNYLYQDQLVCIQMTKDVKEVSSNVQWDGEYRKLDTSFMKYETEAYCIDEENHNYGASIVFGNGYYKISGNFEENEFLEIISKIYFKNV